MDDSSEDLPPPFGSGLEDLHHHDPYQLDAGQSGYQGLEYHVVSNAGVCNSGKKYFYLLDTFYNHSFLMKVNSVGL